MRSKRTILVVTLALITVACSQSDVEKFAFISLHAEQGVERGIPIMRTLREAGKRTPQQNLDLAREVKKITDIHLSALNVALSSNPDGGDLATQIKTLADEADRLQKDGTLNVGENNQLIFDLAISEAKNELSDLASSLANRKGVNLPVSDKTRANLLQAKDAAQRNSQALDAAIAELEKLTGQ